SSMIGKLVQNHQRSGLVFKKDSYQGVVEKKGLLRLRIDVSDAKIRHFVQKTPLVNEHADVMETAYMMFTSNLDFLPVESNKKIIGVIDSLDLATIAVQLPELSNLQVKDVNVEQLPLIAKGDPLAKVLEIMHEQRVEQVPIFDQGRVYGIISYRDLLQKYYSAPPRRETSTRFSKEHPTKSATPDQPSLPALPAASFSTNENLLAVSRKDSLKNAVSQMAAKNVSSALIMDNGEFAGLLTTKNILRLVGSFEIPQNFNIQFVGLNKLDVDTYELKSIKKIASNEAFKLQREINNEFKLVVHIKQYSKTGRKHKYSVHLKIEFPGQMVAVDEDDWDIRRAFHKAFGNAKTKMKKMFRGEKGKKEFS
ncbi:MAG: CBS domain-containing protein, partial [Nanoarchaeota archaeon]|nr:CBS domain-containing protein [Nanoarchaeota archaeon]